MKQQDLSVILIIFLLTSGIGCVGSSLGQKDVRVENLVFHEIRPLNETVSIKAFALITSNREGLWYTLTYDGFENMESYGRALKIGNNNEDIVIIPNNPDLVEIPITFCFSEDRHITWSHETEEYKQAIKSPDVYCKVELLNLE